MRLLLKIGIPSGVQFMLEMGAFTIMTVIIAKLGQTQMAGHQIALAMIHIAFLPAVALGEGTSILVSRAVGAQLMHWVKPLGYISLKIVTLYMLACSAIFILLAKPVLQLFTTDVAVQQTASRLLTIAALFVMFDGINIISRCVLRGTGDTRIPAIIGISASWICTPPLTWFLAYHLGLGAMGGWLGLTAEIFVSGSILFWRFHSQGWLNIAQTTSAAIREQPA